MRAAIVLQARMGSSRLPGKVLARLDGRTILEYCLARLSASGLNVIVATTDRPADDAVAEEARACGAEVFRGDERDVLARFLAAARAFDLTEVVRATADNPFVDPDSPRRVLACRRRLSADHVVERGLPVGAAVEAVAVAALELAAEWSTDPYDREHVTSFVRRDRRFRAHGAVAPGDVRRPGVRLTVDTPADLAFARAICDRLGPGATAAPLGAVIHAAETLLAASVADARMRQGA